MERVKGVEPSSPAWKAGVIAVIRHPLREFWNLTTEPVELPNTRALRTGLTITKSNQLRRSYR